MELINLVVTIIGFGVVLLQAYMYKNSKSTDIESYEIEFKHIRTWF